VKVLLLHADELVFTLSLVEPVDLGSWFLQGRFGNFGQTGVGLDYSENRLGITV
jgi:hypothetical protein